MARVDAPAATANVQARCGRRVRAQRRPNFLRSGDARLTPRAVGARVPVGLVEPDRELRIAVAGPLVTLGLGGAFLVPALLTHFSSPVDGVTAWLAYINFLLLVFNVIPALPLDGGRVLPSVLWRLLGDHARATSVAVAVSRGFSSLMIGAGVVLFFFAGAIAGIWLVFIGWFLLDAARSETRLAAVQRALEAVPRPARRGVSLLSRIRKRGGAALRDVPQRAQPGGVHVRIASS